MLEVDFTSSTHPRQRFSAHRASYDVALALLPQREPSTILPQFTLGTSSDAPISLISDSEDDDGMCTDEDDEDDIECDNYQIKLLQVGNVVSFQPSVVQMNKKLYKVPRGKSKETFMMEGKIMKINDDMTYDITILHSDKVFMKGTGKRSPCYHRHETFGIMKYDVLAATKVKRKYLTLKSREARSNNSPLTDQQKHEVEYENMVRVSEKKDVDPLYEVKIDFDHAQRSWEEENNEEAHCYDTAQDLSGNFCGDCLPNGYLCGREVGW